MCFPKIDSSDNFLRLWSVSASPFHPVLSLFLLFHFSKVKIPVIHSHIIVRITLIKKLIANFQNLKHKNTVKCCVPWSLKFVWIKTFQKQRHYFANTGLSSQGYGFSSGHVWMWELDCEEIWVPKNWCFWTVVLEKTLESPLDCKEIQSILKEISPGISLEGMMLKLKLQYFGHLMQRVDSLEKTDAGRDWGQEEKGTTEDEMAGWHHWLDGH